MTVEEALEVLRQWCASYHGCSVVPGGTAAQHQKLYDALQVVTEACATES